MGRGVRLALVRVEYKLDETVRVPQVDENEPAVVPAAMDPPGEADGAARIGGAEVSAKRVFEHPASVPKPGDTV
jgi:hypothetical protein